MRVRLNLSTKALQSHRKFLAGSGILSAVAAVVFLILGWHVYAVRRADERIRAESLQIQQELTGLAQQRTTLERFFAREENAKLHERAAFLNSLIDARSFDWTQMFIDLEKILPPGVRVVSIEPKQEKGRAEVKFTVGASSDEAKIKFLKALEGSESFADIKLLGESHPTQGVPSDHVIVELKAEYSKT